MRHFGCTLLSLVLLASALLLACQTADLYLNHARMTVNPRSIAIRSFQMQGEFTRIGDIMMYNNGSMVPGDSHGTVSIAYSRDYGFRVDRDFDAQNGMDKWKKYIVNDNKSILEVNRHGDGTVISTLGGADVNKAASLLLLQQSILALVAMDFPCADRDVRALGKTLVDGKSELHLACLTKNGDIDLFFDSISYELLSVEYQDPLYNVREQLKTSGFSKVNGVQVPLRIERFVSGHLTEQWAISNVVINNDISPLKFKP